MDYLEIKELYHHGIKGQNWGVKNGPPYPLNYSDHTAEEKKSNPKGILGAAKIKRQRKKEDKAAYKSKKNDITKRFNDELKKNEDTSDEDNKYDKYYDEYKQAKKEYKAQKKNTAQANRMTDGKVKTSSILATGFGALAISGISFAAYYTGVKTSNKTLKTIGFVTMGAAIATSSVAAQAQENKNVGKYGKFVGTMINNSTKND